VIKPVESPKPLEASDPDKTTAIKEVKVTAKVPTKVYQQKPASTERVMAKEETVSKVEHERMVAAFELQLQEAHLQCNMNRDKLVQAESKIALLDAELTAREEQIDELEEQLTNLPTGGN